MNNFVWVCLQNFNYLCIASKLSGSGWNTLRVIGPKCSGVASTYSTGVLIAQFYSVIQNQAQSG